MKVEKHPDTRGKLSLVLNSRWFKLFVLVIIMGIVAFVTINEDTQAATSLAAFIISSVACFAATLSYEWSIRTTRPFIYRSGQIVVANEVPDKVSLTFPLINTGPIPASNAIATVEFFDEAERITEDNLSQVYSPTNDFPVFLTVFPNAHFYKVITLDLKNPNDKLLLENLNAGKLRIRLRIDYKGPHTTHTTIDTDAPSFVDGMTGLHSRPEEPQKWT